MKPPNSATSIHCDDSLDAEGYQCLPPLMPTGECLSSDRG